MKKNKRLGLPALRISLALLILFFALQVHTLSLFPAESLSPDRLHEIVGRKITEILRQFHYNHQKINNSLSSEFLDLYLDRLDPSRLYFLASDIEEFENYRFLLDDSLKAGNVGPAYFMFNRFKTRVEERIEYALEQLQHEFDFTADDYYQIDRRDENWPKTADQLNRLWHKRLKHEALNLKLAGKEWQEIQENLTKRYTNFENRINQYNSEDVFKYYMNALSEIYDPHTAYFSPITAENFGIDMSLSFEGIGAQLTTEDEFTKVVRILPGGPAERSEELAPNDKIIGVGQGKDGEIVDVIGMRLDDVVQKIRGPKGSVVRLEVIPATSRPGSPPEIISLVRDEIILEERAAKSQTVELTDNGSDYKLGVITIPSFYADLDAQRQGEKNYRRTTTDVRKLLAELKQDGIDGLLIDLRRNGGGSLQEAIDLTGLFIEKGPVVQVKESRGAVSIKRDTDPDIVYDGPLAVLVSRRSASASEIFAAAIQDYGRGIVLGGQTFGKGTVQNLLNLNRFPSLRRAKVGQMKITIAMFYRITGGTTQHRGVHPDITFPSIYQARDFGESSQEHALPFNTIEPTSFQPHDRVSKYLSTLRFESKKRIAKNQEFQYIKEDIELYKERDEQNLVTLNEAKRRAEHEENKARQLARVNERRKARGLEPLEKGDEIPDEDKAPDVLLEESQLVLADLIELSESGSAAHLTKTDSERRKNSKKSTETVDIDN
ncbi:tail-specific protease [candidate division KSB1 bacterium]|nr:tail-specific protease [candidate division KSB1 bacterium]NIR71396.1 tail-specific protease [candidate division KSB1 bacterium]NIS26290.1 tail-specific protease [candidate division KSB1 bacterium]NIT73053.1 tail-specific protease [candidate division KSB1 bacterium]NIU26960.1 tail-specific protease [candidate division KSB1 bacterium]